LPVPSPSRLSDLRVVDLGTGIAGGYATKLFADAGADVIKVEPPGGDPLRSRSAGRGPLPAGEDGALFRFLGASKRSVVGRPDDDGVQRLIESADLVVETATPGRDEPRLDVPGLLERQPALVVLSITPFGQFGPYRGRPWSEFTIQAECGSIAGRGLPEQAPIMAGGQTTFWIGGTFAAVAALAATQYARETGFGEWIDFSLLEVMNIATSVFTDLNQSLLGRPTLKLPARSVEIPSIEPTLDGWVGVNTNTRQQYDDFCLMIEKPEWREHPDFPNAARRWRKRDEWNEGVRAWTRAHTTAEAVELASQLRIPVAPVGDGASTLEHEHFKVRGVFVKNPRGGFLQPRPPYLIDGVGARPAEPAPKLGQHDGGIETRKRSSPRRRGTARTLPLDGLRVLDATNWWAGPSATQMLANLGADVIHLEAAHRPDGMRLLGGSFFGREERWWEFSNLFLGVNFNKRDLTLDLGSKQGRDYFLELVSRCDFVFENYSPRVMDQFGLDWKTVHERNPRAIMIRMPAFGLDGPWRDHVGFAQTMEQMTGLAWLTGHLDDQPRIQRGPCDPLAGMHAAFAALVALEERRRTGTGSLVECTMVEGALNAAAEQIVEYGDTGFRMHREGNRSFDAAPQGLYACRGHEQWLALTVENDEQWRGLRHALGDPEWMHADRLASHAGRRAAQDELDRGIAAWAAGQALDAAVRALLAAGVPAAAVYDGRESSQHPQLVARRFFEQVDHPLVGTHPIPTVPFRFASLEVGRQAWIRCPSPSLGQHNREILSELSVDEDTFAALERDGIVGEKPGRS